MRLDANGARDRLTAVHGVDNLGHARQYDVLIVEDAVGDRDIPRATSAEVTKMVLKELGDTFGTIV